LNNHADNQRVRLLPNPCTFAINEIVISLSAVDILFHLRREELVQKAEEADPEPSQAAESKDTMAGLVRHVLGQRNFYPIFPPTETHASEVNLDVTHFGLLKMDGPQPDLLILPSKLKHFSKVSHALLVDMGLVLMVQIVDSTLVVNPSHLAKAHSAGTFAKITVHPMKRSELGDGSGMDLDEDLRDHALYDRARSEIWRI
jgi:DNA polymerase alpha subunit B